MKVLLNVGGVLVETRLETLAKRAHDTSFYHQCVDAARRNQTLFFDENIETFCHVMEWIREGLVMRTICVPKLRQIQKLALRLGLPRLAQKIHRYLYPAKNTFVGFLQQVCDAAIACEKTKTDASLRELLQETRELLKHPEVGRVFSKLHDDKKEKDVEVKLQMVFRKLITCLLADKLKSHLETKKDPKKKKNPQSHRRLIIFRTMRLLVGFAISRMHKL